MTFATLSKYGRKSSCYKYFKLCFDILQEGSERELIPEKRILLQYAVHCGTIMHTSLLPGGQQSLFKAIQIQIKQTHKSPGQNQINSSSFCAIKSACL